MNSENMAKHCDQWQVWRSKLIKQQKLSFKTAQFKRGLGQ